MKYSLDELCMRDAHSSLKQPEKVWGMSTNKGFPSHQMSVDNGSHAEYSKVMGDGQYQDKYQKLQQQHEIEKRVLLAQFHLQSSSLQQHHQQQLQAHLKMVLSQQQEQRAMDPSHFLSETADLVHSVNNKEKNSANASNAVKKRLQKLIYDRQKVKVMDGYSLAERTPSLHWAPSLDCNSEKRELMSDHPSVVHNKFTDFPLRKTASEPNLKVKSRLRQKLSCDQRSSPLLSRRSDVKAEVASRIKKKLNSEFESSPSSCKSTPNSGPNSPPYALTDINVMTGSKNLEVDIHAIGIRGDPSGDLYTSPSLPNISLALSHKQNDGGVFSLSKSKAAKLVGRTASLPGPLGQSSSTAIGGTLTEFDLKTASAQASVLQHQPFTFGLSDLTRNVRSPPGPIRTHQQARPHKALSRTHSAPTSVTSQLQHHLLQKRQQKLLEQLRKNPDKFHIPSELAAMDRFTLRDDVVIPGHPLMDTMEHAQQPSYNPPAKHPVLLKHPLSSRMMPTASLREKALGSAEGFSHPGTHEMDTHYTRIPHFRNQLHVDASVDQRSMQHLAVNKIANHKPLQRTKSSPAAPFLKKHRVQREYRFTTGIAYSPVMLRHGCACGDDHIEHAGRLQAIWNRLIKCGIVNDHEPSQSRCEFTGARKATTDELQLVHTQEHTLRYGTTSLARKELDLESKFIVLPCGGVGVDNGVDVDTVWNELETINAARMAVGCTVDLAMLVAQRHLKNGFALVRPPGHHAQKNLAMAFCYFNSVAVAARKLQVEKLAKKILILDWDVHHCNGTQNIFYDDPSVLVISIHRYDNASFFPGTGALDEAGTDAGVGFNINLGFSDSLNPPINDADYLAVMRCIVMPVAEQFQPDFVLVSAGFSPAAGHSSGLGGYNVSPQCFGVLTEKLLQLAAGKLVMVLEGGFELEPLCECSELCVRTLLGEEVQIPSNMTDVRPSPNAAKCIKEVISIHRGNWKCLQSSGVNINLTYREWLRISKDKETCDAMALLSVQSSGVVEGRLDEQQHPHSPPVTAAVDLTLNPGTFLPQKSERSDDQVDDVSESMESSPVDVVGIASPAPASSQAIDSETDIGVIDQVGSSEKDKAI